MSTQDTTTGAVPGQALPLAPGRWTLDTNHSGISFSIRHLGLSKVRGRFNSFDATLDVDPEAAGTRVEATVDMASVDTSNADRDAHLRSPELLDVERHPTMRFESTGIVGEGADWTMEGTLTIAGVSRPVAFEVEFNGVEEFQVENYPGELHAGFGTTGTVSRKDYGLGFGPLGAMLGDAVRFELDLQFIAPAD